MAHNRHGRTAPVGEYAKLHITTVLTASAVTAFPATGTLQADGTWLGSVIINKVGTGDTITLLDGGTAFAVITPVAGATYKYDCACDGGLTVTTAGTIGDYTLTFLDMPPKV